MNNWFNGVDSTNKIVYHSNQIQSYKVDNGVTKNEMESLMSNIMDNHLTKYFKYQGKELAAVNFVPKNGSKGHYEYVFKNGSRQRVRGKG